MLHNLRLGSLLSAARNEEITVTTYDATQCCNLDTCSLVPGMDQEKSTPLIVTTFLFSLEFRRLLDFYDSILMLLANTYYHLIVHACHRLLAHRHFVFLQNFVKSSLSRRFTKDLKFCGLLLKKIKINTIAGEGKT